MRVYIALNPKNGPLQLSKQLGFPTEGNIALGLTYWTQLKAMKYTTHYDSPAAW